MFYRKKEEYARKYDDGDAYVDDLLEYGQELEVLQRVLNTLFRLKLIGRDEQVEILNGFLIDHALPVESILKIKVEISKISQLAIASLVLTGKISLFQTTCNELTEIIEYESRYIDRIRKKLAGHGIRAR